MSAKFSSKNNPEARLQASVAKDIKLRAMDEHAKHQQDALNVAKWEAALPKKDSEAARKRMEGLVSSDNALANQSIQAIRRARLEELYARDEQRYEEELAMKGLSFRKYRS